MCLLLMFSSLSLSVFPLPRAGMKYPIYLVDNGQHGKDFEANQNKWTWQTSPIQGNVDAYEFQWQAISRVSIYAFKTPANRDHNGLITN